MRQGCRQPVRCSHHRCLFHTIFSFSSLILIIVLSGCLSSPPGGISPSGTPSPSGTQGIDALPAVTNDPGSDPLIQKHSSTFDSLLITVHNITVKSVRKRSGDTFLGVVLDLSVKNRGLNESFFFDNRSLISFQSDSEHLFPEYPQSEYFSVNITSPLLNRTAAPGEEIRGEVYFFLNPGVDSMSLYLRYPDWTIVGGEYLPDFSDATLTVSDTAYRKYLELEVPSAVRKATIPGWKASPGHGVAIINVSITNHNPETTTIPSEQLWLLTEKPVTLEHGGDKLAPEMARDYLRFPIVVPPGGMTNGSVFFGIYSGTRINKIALADNNLVIHSLVDLNGIYRYE
ncbi:MAG: hypothetical protein BWY93_00880 [Euryarchaeota archaeon ADurb.BinA087]|nr:MAG: hypothetical protein BWY93_00880 [Euryarchaeota archaeon ADurb.BinA087]HNQ26061.1 hypothetical protein [Methanoregulaceae archaeon]HQA81322.1 hypothetical protein [Methanoregulaceae archaeon]